MLKRNFGFLSVSAFSIFASLGATKHAQAAPQSNAAPKLITAQKSHAAQVPYQLPTSGPLPKTYRVTLAITDPKNPDWIRATASEKLMLADKTLSLQAGWNRIMFRGYCVGYPPLRVGLVVKGAPEKLWKLQLSNTPPA